MKILRNNWCIFDNYIKGNINGIELEMPDGTFKTVEDCWYDRSIDSLNIKFVDDPNVYTYASVLKWNVKIDETIPKRKPNKNGRWKKKK